jgi:hypothetical protein
MANKKKKKKQQHSSSSRAAVKQEIAEEILALEAIYEDDFSLHEDGIGFQLHVVPHPGYHSDNHCSVELHVRSVVLLLAQPPPAPHRQDH